MNLSTSYYNLSTSYSPKLKARWQGSAPTERRVSSKYNIQNKYTIQKTDFWTITQYSISSHCLNSTSIKVNKMLDHLLLIVHKIVLHAHYWFPGTPSLINYPTDFHYSSSKESCLWEYPILHTKTVKKCQGSEILLYLSVNKWDCHNFIDACKGPTTSGSKTKDYSRTQ